MFLVIISFTYHSFHPGSGVRDPEVYIVNIKAARRVFDVAQGMGINMTLLDIGGGFLGNIGAETDLEKVR